MTRRAFVVLVAVAIAGSACSGPKERVEVGIKEFPTDVILGAQGVTEAPVLTQQATPSAPLLVIRPPASPRRSAGPAQSAAAPTGPCPSAHPFDAPKREAPNRASVAPAAASYLFRNSGTSGAGVLQPQSTRTIKDVVGGGIDFKIEESLAGVNTTTTYHVTPSSDIPEQAGLFIAGIQKSPNDIFTPRPMIKIFEFPAMGNEFWQSSGADPTTGVSMSLQGRIGIETPDGPDAGPEPDIITRARVDACGQVIDAWLVEIGGPSSVAAPDPAGATIIGPGKDLRLKAIYAIATQFGAFSVYDKYQLTGTENFQTVKLINEATISELPKLG